MPASEPFKWRHFQSEIILLNVRWYLRYSLSYRDLAEMMLERGIEVNHTTIYRWVQAYSPELDKRSRRYLKPTNDSWRTDETYIESEKKCGKARKLVDQPLKPPEQRVLDTTAQRFHASRHRLPSS